MTTKTIAELINSRSSIAAPFVVAEHANWSLYKSKINDLRQLWALLTVVNLWYHVNICFSSMIVDVNDVTDGYCYCNEEVRKHKTDFLKLCHALTLFIVVSFQESMKSMKVLLWGITTLWRQWKIISSHYCQIEWETHFVSCLFLKKVLFSPKVSTKFWSSWFFSNIWRILR